jgi:hypothetical protein
MSDVRLHGGVGQINPLANISNNISAKRADENKLNWTYKAAPGLASGKELIQKMGAPPKSNITILGRTIKTNSVAYKNALNNLSSYQKNLSDFDVASPQMMDANQFAKLRSHLQEVVGHADAYLEKHQNEGSKAGRRNVMTELKSMAQNEIQAIDDVFAMRDHVSVDSELKTNIALARGGLHEDGGFNADLTDNKIDRSQSNEKFGSGAVNTVAFLHYTNGEERVVKPLNKTCESGGLVTTAENDLKINPNDMLIGARNIASAKVATLLGVGQTIPMPDIIMHNDVACLAMRVAPGEETYGKSMTLVTDQKTIELYEDAYKNFPDSLKDAKFKRDDNGKWWEVKSGPKDFPFTDAGQPQSTLTSNLQKGLLDLQVLDALLGQTDRNVHNIFIQLDGQQAHVTGIDNDFCLGENSDAIKPVIPPGIKLVANYHGVPPLMSRAMYNQLSGLTEQKLRDTLKGLPEKAISDACNRLKDIQDYADKLDDDGFVVDNFETWTTQADGKTLNASEYLVESKIQNYVQRGALNLRDGKADKIDFPLDANKHQ